MSTTEASPPPTPKNISRIDMALDFLWHRFGNRLVWVFTSSAWLVGVVSSAVAVATCADIVMLPPSSSIRLILTICAIVLTGWLIDLATVMYRLKAWDSVVRSGRPDDIWAMASSLPNKLAGTSACLSYGFACPLIMVVFAKVAHPDTSMLLAVAVMLVIIVTFLMVLGLFGFPLLTRALLRGVGQLDGKAKVRGATKGFQWRLVTAIPVTAVAAATVGVWSGARPGESGGYLLQRELTSSALMLLLAVVPVFFLSYSAIQPLRDLIDGTERVKRGEFGEPVAELSVDEFGTLSRSFNEMLDGLADRQRLAIEVRESRSRIVAAADESRKRIERNIHDGAQQRLVALALDVRLLEDQAPRLSPDELSAAHRRIGDDLKAALSELRELARGLHPSVLTTDGLGPAIDQLASRSSIPVTVDVTATRFPEAVETACYFTVAEGLANVAKYAEATEAAVRIEQRDGGVRLQITDNGVGGADPKAGSGLAGLVDRIAALDGTLTVDSPADVGTTVTVELPIPDHS